MMVNNNVEILKAYTFEWEPTGGWFYYSDKKGRGVMLYTSGKVQFIKLCGSDPHIMQLAEMTAQVINRTNRYHQYTTNGRIWPFKINERIGQSGCRDYYLDLYRKVADSAYVRKCNAAKLHISMYDKVGDFQPMYIGDLIEILIVAIAGHDFTYQAGPKTKMRKIAGVRFARPYRNEIVSADDLDYSPKR